MTYKHSSMRGVTLLLLPSVRALLPYNPTQLFLTTGRHVYQISGTPNLAFTAFDIAQSLEAATQPAVLPAAFPFEANDMSYVAADNGNGISVLVGNCRDGGSATQLWRFSAGQDSEEGTWTQQQLVVADPPPVANFLAAGLSFSPNSSSVEVSFSAFGGMCPSGSSSTSTWTSQATYSNMMITLTNEGEQYRPSAKRSAAIAEAGLTITPLRAFSSISSSGRTVQSQNFVLIGGHTQSAFINMSTVAVYSQPTAAWSIVSVDQPKSSQASVSRRDNPVVEPRSGHTAVLSEDGSMIIVFGGWVGDITHPASPQLAILQMSDDVDGSTTWSWTVPDVVSSPFSSGQGVYGHGAVLLPGGIMMISGGNNIGQSTSKRASSGLKFYNTTSSSWIASYPGSSLTVSTSSDGPPDKTTNSNRMGLGIGLGIGLAILLIAIAICLVLLRRRKQKRIEGERRLRAMALGSEKFHSNSQVFPSNRRSHSGMRSASWGSAQEKQVEGVGVAHPWPPTAIQRHANAMQDFDFGLHDEGQDAARSGHDIIDASPTRGLRRSLHSKGPAGFGNHFGESAAAPAGSVFRIDEEEEVRSVKSPQVALPPNRSSDPFKDPPKVEHAGSDAAAGRRKEVQSWVEDWQSAAESMNLSRNPSHSRTYSNLSQTHSTAQSAGRLSPEKSDRTNSNLSERSQFSTTSTMSLQKSIGGTVTRTLSQRSVSAGYALFAGAAAAMTKFAGSGRESQLDRSASKRSVSMGNSQARHDRPISGESHLGLLRQASPTKSDYDTYRTPPESPIKDYKNYMRTNSLTGQGRVKARSVLGSVKRVFTGTSQVDVEGKVEHFEEVEKEALDTPAQEPEPIETMSYPPSVPFWQGKKGARDWEHDSQHLAPESSTIRRRSGGRLQVDRGTPDPEGEDWDIETAIQQRVVQVMFTVPKERLRVVNADSLSLLSRSDIGERDDDREAEVTRMSSLKERDEGITSALDPGVVSTKSAP